MKNPMESPVKRNEDPQAAQEEEIIAFAMAHALSSEELDTAYQLSVWDFPPEESAAKEPIRKEVYAMAEKMSELTKNGLAINRIPRLIEAKRGHESASAAYYELVDSLHVTNREKMMLKSIVAQKRSGTLTIIDAQTGKTMSEFDIPAEVAKYTFRQDDLPARLTKFFLMCRDRKIEVSFSD